MSSYETPFAENKDKENVSLFSEITLNHLINNAIQVLYEVSAKSQKHKIDTYFKLRELVGSEKEVLVRRVYPYTSSIEVFEKRDKFVSMNEEEYKLFLEAMMEINENHLYLGGESWNNEKWIR